MKSLTISPRVSRDFPKEARHLIGVSGGRDSVALLHLLVNLGYEKLIVCHLNHQLRGRIERCRCALCPEGSRALQPEICRACAPTAELPNRQAKRSPCNTNGRPRF